MYVLNFFRFYMTIDITYFLYIFGDNGANMLNSWAVNKMCHTFLIYSPSY